MALRASPWGQVLRRRIRVVRNKGEDEIVATGEKPHFLQLHAERKFGEKNDERPITRTRRRNQMINYGLFF